MSQGSKHYPFPSWFGWVWSDWIGLLQLLFILFRIYQVRCNYISTKFQLYPIIYTLCSLLFSSTLCGYTRSVPPVQIGYTPNDMHMAAFDWRLSPYFLEKRDSYFTRLKSTIETMKVTSGEKVVLMSHSYGKRVSTATTAPLVHLNSIQPTQRS